MKDVDPIFTRVFGLQVDAKKPDFPIVYASHTFEKLTGYSNAEIIGRNCRFLQAPDGHVAVRSRRRCTDNNAVFYIKTHVDARKECQVSIINYRKGGQVINRAYCLHIMRLRERSISQVLIIPSHPSTALYQSGNDHPNNMGL